MPNTRTPFEPLMFAIYRRSSAGGASRTREPSPASSIQHRASSIEHPDFQRITSSQPQLRQVRPERGCVRKHQPQRVERPSRFELFTARYLRRSIQHRASSPGRARHSVRAVLSEGGVPLPIIGFAYSAYFAVQARLFFNR